MIDVKGIIKDSLNAFESSKERYESLPKVKDYHKLHTSPLVPLDIKIDVALFKKQIKVWDPLFEQWGNEHTHLARYGIALVNQTGTIQPNDPINGSLMAWSKQNPEKALLETDCRTPTAIMNMSCLDPLRVFDNFWTRSNIFRWHKGAKFLPHIDTVVPSPWFRLWATTDDIDVNFYNEDGFPINIGPIEPGRIYLIDTSLVHDAEYTQSGTVYQLFLSVLPTAQDLLAEHITK